MAGATIDIDDTQVRVALHRLAAVGADTQPVLWDMGEQLLNNTKQRFLDQIDPDGIKWQDYAVSHGPTDGSGLRFLLTRRGGCFLITCDKAAGLNRCDVKQGRGVMGEKPVTPVRSRRLLSPI